ncbi:MAG: MFS transporter, partial [Clostridia bacterium]|nr:MFS transporter [Clostridia bacterium]
YALHSFFRKLAQGVGPALALVIMTALGYVGTLGANQSPETALNMRYLVACLYLFSAAMQFVGLSLVYNLDKKSLAKMTEELKARHAAKG